MYALLPAKKSLSSLNTVSNYLIVIALTYCDFRNKNSMLLLFYQVVECSSGSNLILIGVVKKTDDYVIE